MRLRSSLVSMVVVALMVPAMAVAAAPKEKVDVCHVPPGNPGNAHTISISGNALKAHLGHGDTEGPCPAERPGRADDDDDSDDDQTGDNRPPVAVIRADDCVAYGDDISVDGRSSSDLDDDTLSYRWTILTRPSGSTVVSGDLDPNRFAALVGLNPDRLGTYRFGLEVTDPDAASDDATADVSVHMDVELTDGPFVVQEASTVPVTIFFTEVAPQDVTVQLVLDTNVAVVVPEEDDDAGDAISSIVISEGNSRETVYLYGVADADDNDDSTVLNAVVGSTACGDTAAENVEVEDDEKELHLGFDLFRVLFVRPHLEPWVV